MRARSQNDARSAKFGATIAGFFGPQHRRSYDARMPLGPHPGLAKTRAESFVLRRDVALARAPYGRWRSLVEGADIVSEGAVKSEEAGPVYYGSTSVLLKGVASGGVIPDAEIAALSALIANDPHTRLLALRVARREASCRASAPLGVARMEIAVRAAPRGVMIAIDITAPLSSASLRSTSISGR